MARGWESKSVEEQIAEREARKRDTPSITPEQLARQREIESLQLQRTRVLHDLEKATHGNHRESLEAALHFLDKKIAALG